MGRVKAKPVEGSMAPGLTPSIGKLSTALKQGSVGTAGMALFLLTLTLGSSPAAALDINGLVNAAIAISARYARPPASHQGSNAASKRDRDSDDAEDEDSGGRNRKSADTSSQSQHRPASTMRKSMEAAASDPAESMVSLDRSLDDRPR
jgi:hypothetical protein